MQITIGTHNGLFHLDELLGVLTLKLVHERRGDEVEVVRTRDPKLYASCTYLVDIGGVSDAASGRFDHHQKGGAGTRENGTPYASAGLVWRHFGAELAESSEVAAMVDRRLMQPVDYRDNHGPQARDRHVVEFADMLATLFPTWDETDKTNGDSAFYEALKISEPLFRRYIRRVQAECAAADIVRHAIQATKDPRKVFLSVPCPWHEVVTTEAPEALVVVIVDAQQSEWRVECVPNKGTPGHRVLFPSSVRALERTTLVERTGVPDARFIHSSGHLAVTNSLEGAYALAELVLSQPAT